VHDSEGKEFGLAGRTAIGLCRWRPVQNKPFCDGSHKRSASNPSVLRATFRLQRRNRNPKVRLFSSAFDSRCGAPSMGEEVCHFSTLR